MRVDKHRLQRLHDKIQDQTNAEADAQVDKVLNARDELIDTITLDQAKNMLIWFATHSPDAFEACIAEEIA